MPRYIPLLFSLSLCLQAADEPKPAPAPTIDRVGFPENYQQAFEILRVVKDEKKQRIVTVYGNAPAAGVTGAKSLPYPYGSIIVMESTAIAKSPDGKLATDAKGDFLKDKVTGLHVMRREKGFGEAYGPNRTGEWEYVEYNADKSLKTPPAKTASCAECHLKAGAERDFVYHAKLPDKLEK